MSDSIKRKLQEEALHSHHSKKSRVDSVPLEMASKMQSSPTKNQPKKFVIKMKPPKLPANFESDTWNTLQEAVRAIHSSKRVGTSLEELYGATESVCRNKLAANLYSKLQGECEQHIKGEVHKLLNQSSDPSIYLPLVNGIWNDHCEHMLMIRSIFLYLDRTYVIQNANVLSLWDMGLDLFRRYVATHEEVEKKLVSGLLNFIEKERNGETIDRPLLKSLIAMLISIQIYSNTFERAFLGATERYYGAEGVNFIRDFDLADYLRHVERRLQEEVERVSYYLDPITRKPLVTIVETQMIQKHCDGMLNKGFNSLVNETRLEDLKRLYTLFHRVNALNKLRDEWREYIKNTGESMIKDEEKDKTMVNDLLLFKDKLDSVLEKAFSSSDNFSYALKDSFEKFINTRPNKPAEFIAKFVDALLQSGNKGISEEEMEQQLDKVMVLFRFIKGKDIFEAFYKKDLAKRLLLDKSASIDTEKSMISKLKAECGSSFTNKLEGMFKDMDISKDFMAAFRQSPKIEQLGDIDLYVHVLAAGYWPQYATVEVTLPSELAKYLEVFKQFYLSKHNGRRLTWQHSMGHCVLRASFPKGKKEIFLTLFQTVVMLLFNEYTKLSFKEIGDALAMEKSELRRTLESLACRKHRVLAKEPKGKEVGEEDTFSVNGDFKAKLHRIKINSIQLKETVEEQQKTTQNVMQDRQYQIDAAIVRIMKTRKTLTHPLLVKELFEQLKFPVKPVDLKKRIESLIDREYLERNADDAQIYNYLA